MSSVSGVVRSIQDIMRKDAGIDGDAQRLGQLAWMFFLKIIDDRDQAAEFLEDDYVSVVPAEFRWSTWTAKGAGLTGDVLLRFVRDKLFPTLRVLEGRGAEAARATVIRSVFESATFGFSSGVLLRQVCNKINEVDFNSLEDRHTFGDVYEQLLRDLQSAGNSGEFYTPRAVTRFMTEMVDPNVHDVVLDPACGTGGFLAQALDHKIDHYVEGPEDYDQLQASIRGVEKKALPHILCMTNMMVHGLDNPTNIRRGNTLARPLRDYGASELVDVVLTNPPFGGMEEDGIEQNFPTGMQTRETADLFVLLIVALLRDSGRAAVIVPDGFLFGEGIKSRVKEHLLKRCNLHTIVRLPNGVFAPYTTIRTNLLFFEKGSATEEVWFYEHHYPSGYKSYSKTKPITFEEFDAEKRWWGDPRTREGREETAHAWRVSIEQIQQRSFNLDFENPNRPEVVLVSPEILVEQAAQVSAEFEKQARALCAPLKEAVSRIPERRDYAQLFSERFESLAAASGGMQHLRELVLQLACQGMLGPQSADDESVEELLRRVAIAREQDVQAGKGKERKAIAGALGTEAFSLPESWRWVSLDELCSYIQRGKGPRYVDSSSVQIVSQKCVQWTGFTMAPARFLDEAALPSYGSERRLQKGDLLWNSTGTGTIGRINVFPGAGDAWVVADSHVTVVRPALISADYLWCYLASPFIQSTLEANASGSTNQVELSTSVVRRTMVPLPPLAEQVRIVSSVRDLMLRCDELERTLRQRGDIQTALIESLVHKFVTSPVPLSPDTDPDWDESSGLTDREALPAAGDPAEISSVGSFATPDEASLVAAIVKAFHEKSGEPVGNFRLQKAVYFIQRRLGVPTHSAFLKKAAGPYNPTLKYRGGIADALNREFIKQSRGRYGFGYVPANLASLEGDGSFAENLAAARWVRDQFQYRENAEWELYATVDYAAEALEKSDRRPDAETILQFIADEPEWSAKVARLRLTPYKVETALLATRAILHGNVGSA